MGYLTICLLHHTAQEVGIRCITRIGLLDPEECRETLGWTLFDLDGSWRGCGSGRTFMYCTPHQGHHEDTAEKLHPERHSCSPSTYRLHTYHMLEPMFKGSGLVRRFYALLATPYQVRSYQSIVGLEFLPRLVGIELRHGLRHSRGVGPEVFLIDDPVVV